MSRHGRKVPTSFYQRFTVDACEKQKAGTLNAKMVCEESTSSYDILDSGISLICPYEGAMQISS